MTTTVIYSGEEANYPLGIAGASATVRQDTAAGEGPMCRVGTMTWGTKGQKWVYVGPAAANLAGAATPASGVAIAVSGSFIPSAGVGYTAYAPLNSGQYGWVAAVDFT